MASSRVLIGDIEVATVVDAVGYLAEQSELYPDQPAEDWALYHELYPELFAGARWKLACACFVLRSSGTTLLVDTGVGPPGLWDWKPEYEGGLPDGLGAVSYTHLTLPTN